MLLASPGLLFAMGSLLQGVSEDMLARLFKRLPGMEYCDLKKDYATGKSKVRCRIRAKAQEGT